MRLNNTPEATEKYVDGLLAGGHDFYERSRIAPLIETMALTPQLADKYAEYLQKEGKQIVIKDGLKALAKHGDKVRPQIEQFTTHRSMHVRNLAEKLLNGGE